MFGPERAEVKAIAGSFSEATPLTGEVELGIKNAMVDLLGYPHRQETAWSQWLLVPPTELRKILARWKSSTVRSPFS